MKQEEQVVSQPIAKKMAELGFKQDSLFWWWEATPMNWKLLYKPLYKQNYAAYTIPELEKEIFQWIENQTISYDFVIHYSPQGGVWNNETFDQMYEVQLINWDNHEKSIMERADTGTNARARIVIHLKQQTK